VLCGRATMSFAVQDFTSVLVVIEPSFFRRCMFQALYVDKPVCFRAFIFVTPNLLVVSEAPFKGRHGGGEPLTILEACDPLPYI
jgi:hypothetical protein